jgi:hypothetical protein
VPGWEEIAGRQLLGLKFNASVFNPPLPLDDPSFLWALAASIANRETDPYNPASLAQFQVQHTSSLVAVQVPALPGTTSAERQPPLGRTGFVYVPPSTQFANGLTAAVHASSSGHRTAPTMPPPSAPAPKRTVSFLPSQLQGLLQRGASAAPSRSPASTEQRPQATPPVAIAPARAPAPPTPSRDDVAAVITANCSQSFGRLAQVQANAMIKKLDSGVDAGVCMTATFQVRSVCLSSLPFFQQLMLSISRGDGSCQLISRPSSIRW